MTRRSVPPQIIFVNPKIDLSGTVAVAGRVDLQASVEGGDLQFQATLPGGPDSRLKELPEKP